MAVEVIEGFDEFATADGARCYPAVSGAVDTATVVVEGRSWLFTNNTGITFQVPANAEYYVGFHFAPDAGNFGNTACIMLQFFEGATEHGRLTWNVDGTFTISRAGSIPATSAYVGPFLADTFHWLEVYYKVHDSTGAWEVRLDHNVIIGPTGSLDTRNGGAVGTINAIRTQTQLSGPSWYLDNFYAASGATGFLGEGRVVTDVPTADGTNTAWAASAGADWQCVDEVPNNGDTDYISSSTAGHIDTFQMATLGVTGTIKAVAIRFFGRKDDAGARSVTPHVRSGGTEYDHATSHAQATTLAGYQGIWETDPDTGVAWLDSDIDAVEYGVKNV